MDSILKIDPEDELLLLCTKEQLTNKFKMKVESLINSDFDWDYFVKRVTYHKIQPLIYTSLRPFEEIIPPNIYNDLKLLFIENTQKNLFFLKELIKIVEIFEEHEVSLISYKGPTLAYFAYDDLSMRQFSDLDFLVNVEDLSQAKELLNLMGYENDLILNKKQEKKFISHQQEFKFFNKQNNITIDLHWKVSVLHSIKTDYLTQRTMKVKIFNEFIRTLLPEEMFLVICIHNASHKWSHLSLLCDLSGFISRNDIDWFKVNVMANKMGLITIVNINFFLMKNILGINSCQKYTDFDKDIKSANIACQIQKKILNKSHTFSLIDEFRTTINIRDNTILGLHDAMINIFRPTSYEWREIPLPSEISFIYIFLRPFLLLTRYKI